MANDRKKTRWGPSTPGELLNDAYKGREARLWLDSANTANERIRQLRISEENRIKTETENKNIASDLASLNPISKPGSTPQGGYAESKNIGIRIPEINPTKEYGGDGTIYSLSPNKTATAVRVPKPPVNLNISGPKSMEEINTGITTNDNKTGMHWIQEDGAPLQYRANIGVEKFPETRREKRAKRLTKKKKNIN